MSDFAAFQLDPRSGQPSYGDDSRLYVEFSMETVARPFKSEQEGRPIFEDVPHITIICPGDKTKTIRRPVEDSDMRRFPQQWGQFQNKQEQVSVGTPITEVPWIPKSTAMELKGMRIFTAEQLAGIPDSALTFFGGREMRTKMQHWLDAAKGGSAVTSLEAENAQLKMDVQRLQKQLADLGAEADRPKRGRPPNKKDEDDGA